MKRRSIQSKAPASAKPAVVLEPIEIPAGGEPWPMASCIAQGVEDGADDAVAVEACELIRQQWGDPSDPSLILVPDTESRERLLGAAVASVEGGARVDADKRQNRWWQMAKTVCGIQVKPAPARATTKARSDLVASTMFGGAPVSRSERRSLGWYKGS